MTKKVQQLREGLEQIKHTEAYEDYGVPYVLNIWEQFEIQIDNYYG